MTFTSIYFILLCFVLSLLVNYLNLSSRIRLFVLLACSAGFYLSHGFPSLLILVAVICITHFTLSRGSIYMWTGIMLIVSLVVATRFLISSQSFLIIPLGVSFYSLQAISVLVDSNNGRFKNGKSLVELSSFLSFFAIAPAGPIHRASELIPQLRTLSSVPISNFVIAGKRILWGCFCKMIIADKLGYVVEPIFTDYLEQNGVNLFAACCLYSFELFFDLFGYTEIALGVGLLFGIELKRNFNRPYSISSFKEFWRRWHISVSTWFRDYIYIPLGGNTKGYIRFCCAIMITFLASAIWHGLGVNFILWGITLGFFYLLEDALSKSRFARGRSNRIFSILKVVSFFLLVTFTWTLFRFTDVSQLAVIWNKIALIQDWHISDCVSEFQAPQILFITLAIAALIFFRKIEQVVEFCPSSFIGRITESISIVCFILLIVIYGDIGQKEFVYFNF